ncbi:MAG: transposase, partial [Burkholderiales bacterium]|nr:transposase [Burkholderiales bacterium]
PQHIVQRGNNLEPCFFADEDCLYYLQCLKEAARNHACRVHAYVLMPDHMHLLATPRTRGGFAGMLKTVRDRYAQHIRHTYRRGNALWDGRYKASLIQPDRHLLDCYRYIELNPVRAAIVKHPANYRWSSHVHHALGVADELITEHAQYRNLGTDAGERHQAYRELSRDPLEPEVFKAIEAALNEERVLGDDQFRQQIEIAQKRKLSLAEAGQLFKQGGSYAVPQKPPVSRDASK